MRDWNVSHRILRASSTAQAVYLTERSIARYEETKASWISQFEVARIDVARDRLDRKSLLKIAAGRYFKPLRVFAF